MTNNERLLMPEIIEGNKLIAGFMGFIHRDSNVYKVPEGEDLKYLAYHLNLNKMPYHTSWDWLMPVVEKIESLGYDSRIMGNNSDGGFLCDFVDGDNNEAACKTNYTSKLEAVYAAVVAFIQWYNNNHRIK
jgi:hypothetical protein